LLKSTSIKRML